jgi:hypothetical protein
MNCLLSPALELLPPDISAWRKGGGPDSNGPGSNGPGCNGPDSDGIDYVRCFDSGRPGPSVVVTALARR